MFFEVFDNLSKYKVRIKLLHKNRKVICFSHEDRIIKPPFGPRYPFLLEVVKILMSLGLSICVSYYFISQI